MIGYGKAVNIFFVLFSVTPSECIEAHNVKRKRHKDTPDVAWNQYLAEGSQMWSFKLGTMNTDPFNVSVLHSITNEYGENIYVSLKETAASQPPKPCKYAVDSWYVLLHLLYFVADLLKSLQL